MRKLTSKALCYLLIAGILGPASANADEYFDWLRRRPETILARGYQSQAEIDADIAATNPANRVRPPVYDSTVKGARWTIPAGVASIAGQDQLHPRFGTVSSGNLLLVWEARWDSAFAGNLGGLETHKAFQLASDSSGDKRRIEIRTRFSLAPSNAVAMVDARGYIWNPSGQPLPGQTGQFTIEPNKWTRFWAFLDFNARTFSLWVADEDTKPVRLFNRMQYSNMSGGIDHFWFEFNSSQERGGGSSLTVWGRNFAALRNVSDVEAIVNQGDVEPGDPGEPEVLPDAPSGLTVR